MSGADVDAAAQEGSAVASPLWIMLLGPLGAALLGALAAVQAMGHRPGWPWGLCAGVFILYGRQVSKRLNERAGSSPNRWAAAGMLLLLVIATSFWAYVRWGGAPWIGPNQHGQAKQVTQDLVKALAQQQQEALAKLLPDMLATDERRQREVSAADAEAWLDSGTRQRLQQHSHAPWRIVSVALAARNLAAAEKLIREGYSVGAEDRVPLADNLATADAAAQGRWQALMEDLAGYRERALRGVESRRDKGSLEQIVARQMLRQAAGFDARFTSADAYDALNQCNASALQFILPQATQAGDEVSLNLGPLIHRLIDVDIEALESGAKGIVGASVPGRSAFDADPQDHPCLGTLRWLLKQTPARPGAWGTMAFEPPLQPLAVGGQSGVDLLGKAIHQTHAAILQDLRERGVMRDISDADFDPERLQRHLQEHPPAYTHALKATVLLLEKEPQPGLLSTVFQIPLLYQFQPQFSADARRALQRWNAQKPSAEWRAQLREELNQGARVLVQEGKTEKQQTRSVNLWLEDAGFRCQLKFMGRAYGDSKVSSLKC